MRILIGGLMGLCLLASMPMQAEARGDARASLQHGKASARPAASPPRAMPASSPARQPVLHAPRGFAPPARPGSGPVHRFAAQPSRYASVQSSRAATIQRGRQAAAIPYGGSSSQMPNGLRQTAMASCVTRNGRRSCSGSVRSVAFRWGGDLAPAAMTQSSCPDGTIATIAIGHTDVVRCVPL